MTFGQFAVGLGLVLMALQFYLIARTSNSARVSRPMLTVMVLVAVMGPVIAYLAFYQIFPELGAKMMTG